MFNNIHFFLIIGSGLLFIGSGIGFLLLIYFANKKEIKKKDPLLAYLDNYKTKFENMEITELPENRMKNLKKCILFEKTPLGNVIMYFDEDNFIYYCDRDLSFNYLEAVARKYVVTFSCKSIYKIYENEKEKYKDEENISAKATKVNIDENKKSVYASFKKYNKPKLKINDNEPILQNKYRYNGKIREFELLQKIVKNQQEKKYTIQDFLMQIKNKN